MWASPVSAQAVLATGWNQLELPSLGDPAQYLPVPQAEIRLVIRLSDRRVYLYSDEELTASYPIAVGKRGWETPTGVFAVRQKLKNPAWEHPWTGEIVPPGPNNPLGAGWVGFWTDGVNSIGFHGTPDESLIGQAVSHGCVRMRNADVLALYEQVEVGTLVVVEQ
ncbi:MAG: L,D-transpeptidase [Cyanophyceae cyanobacterium]